MIKTKKGFTMVELMLAMLYVALLLMTIAQLIMHIMDSYKKGMAIKEVNINGRAIIDDITRTVASAPPVGILVHIDPNGPSTPTYDANGNLIIITGKEGEAVYSDGTVMPDNTLPNRTSFYRAYGSVGAPDGGVLCTGNYSYIWKHADRIISDTGRGGQAAGTYNTDAVGNVGNLRVNGSYNFRLMKTRDPSRKACLRNGSGGLINNFEIGDDSLDPVAGTPANNSNNTYHFQSYVELLTNNEMDLALYDFKAFAPASSSASGQVYYGFSFILGTLRGVNRQGGIIPNEVCIPPQARVNDPLNPNQPVGDREHIGFDFEYCSVNKFNFSARASGAVRGGSK